MKKRCVALLDVDHTLLMSDDSLNHDLIRSLLQHEITHIYLFTDMTLHPPEIENRNGLIKTLEETGFAVHNVLTPNDLTWVEMDPNETKKLHAWCFVEKLYKGKFYGTEFEEFVLVHSTEFPNMAGAIPAKYRRAWKRIQRRMYGNAQHWDS